MMDASWNIQSGRTWPRLMERRAWEALQAMGIVCPDYYLCSD